MNPQAQRREADLPSWNQILREAWIASVDTAQRRPYVALGFACGIGFIVGRSVPIRALIPLISAAARADWSEASGVATGAATSGGPPSH